MKYSDNFERDYAFYFNNRFHFQFCGTKTPKFNAIFDKNGITAKEAFHQIDTNGKNIPTKEPYLLNDLLLCKASVNFNIKQWALGRKDGTLPLSELSCRLYKEKYNKEAKKDNLLVHTQIKSYYFKDMETYYNFPNWVIEAIENQKLK